MRIGEFAQKHNTTIDTIRHYIDLGLLVAGKQGGQYRFDEDDSWDLEKILELKQFDFSLSQIQELLTFHRLAGEYNPEYRRYYLDLLERKKTYFYSEINRLKELESIISDKIVEFKTVGNKLVKLGLPISSMDILACPKCNLKLEIFNGMLEKNMIISGKIKCECGFTAKIENGIYIDENDVEEKTILGKRMPTKKEYLEKASPRYVNFYYSGMAKSIDYINQYSENPEYILELDSCVGSFLMQYIEELPEDSTYILNCRDLSRLSAMKSTIELYHKPSNFIFLCCDASNLPIGKSQINLVIDHGKTNEFFRTNSKELSKVYSKLLKEKGIVVGTYRFVDNKSSDYKSLPDELKDRYNRDKIINNLEKAGLEEIDSIDIGPVVEDNQYNLDVGGRELYMIIYAGRKI